MVIFFEAAFLSQFMKHVAKYEDGCRYFNTVTISF